jgi:hypothetical protein
MVSNSFTYFSIRRNSSSKCYSMTQLSRKRFPVGVLVVGSREVKGIHIRDRTVLISIIKIIYLIFFYFSKKFKDIFFKKIKNIAH